MPKRCGLHFSAHSAIRLYCLYSEEGVPLFRSNVPICPAFRINRFYSERKAHPVGVFADLFQCSLIIIELPTVNSVCVYDDVTMDVLFINVCRYNHLTIITESLARKSSRDLVCKLRRDIVLWVKRLNIVNSLYAPLPCFGRGALYFSPENAHIPTSLRGMRSLRSADS